MPKTEQLNQLRDIHVPDPIGWWPPAPGWIILTVLVMIALGFITRRVIRHLLNQRSKRKALRVLQQYRQDYLKHHNSPLTCACLSELLKRVALIYYPRTQVASLQGQAWIDFLTRTARGLDFNTVRTLLIEVPYLPPHQHATLHPDAQPLIVLTQSWIQQRSGRCSN
jgi:hypothetical protein